MKQADERSQRGFIKGNRDMSKSSREWLGHVRVLCLRLPVLALFVLVLSCLLSGCGAGGEKTEAAMDYVAETAASAPAMAFPSARNEAEAVAEASGSLGFGKTEGGVYEELAGVGSGAGASEVQEALSPEEALDRKLIRNVELTVQTREYEALMELFHSRVSELGGYIERSVDYGTEYEGDGKRSGYVSLRIPSDKVDAFLDTALEGATVIYRSENTEDVTLRYTDLETRKEALRIEQDRLLELLAKAENMESIIAIESRMSEIRYELESIESSLRSYDNQVRYSTVNIDVSEVAVIDAAGTDGFAARVKSGLSRNVKELLLTAENAAIAFLTNLPLLIVVAVIGVLVYSIVRLLWKRLCRNAHKRMLPPLSKIRNQRMPKESSLNEDTTKTDADDEAGKTEFHR